jgi:hypothetical protein
MPSVMVMIGTRSVFFSGFMGSGVHDVVPAAAHGIAGTAPA